MFLPHFGFGQTYKMRLLINRLWLIFLRLLCLLQNHMVLVLETGSEDPADRTCRVVPAWNLAGRWAQNVGQPRN